MNTIHFNYDEEAFEYVGLPCEVIAQKLRAQGVKLPVCLDRLSLPRFRELLKQAGIRKWTLDQFPAGEVKFSWEATDTATLGCQTVG